MNEVVLYSRMTVRSVAQTRLLDEGVWESSWLKAQQDGSSYFVGMTLVKGLSTILGCGGHCFLHGFELQYADQCPEKELIDYLSIRVFAIPNSCLWWIWFSPWTISRVSHICSLIKKSLININANATRHSTWNVFHFLQVEEARDHVGQKKIAGGSWMISWILHSDKESASNNWFFLVPNLVSTIESERIRQTSDQDHSWNKSFAIWNISRLFHIINTNHASLHWNS